MIDVGLVFRMFNLFIILCSSLLLHSVALQIACLADFVKITELAHMYSIQICWNESEGVFYLNVPWMDPTSVQMAIERQGTCLLGDERLKAYKY